MRRFDVRSPSQGLAAIRHPAITANYKKALRVKPKHKKAVLLPCAGTKPFPDAPSHRAGYLKALEGKKLDRYVVSEPLGVVPYSWSRDYPQAHYDFPPHYLKGEGRNLLVKRIADWLKKVGPKYDKLYMALPGHHKRLVLDALRLAGDPVKIKDVGLGACLESGSCPPGHVRPTTHAYRGFLRAKANPGGKASRRRRVRRCPDCGIQKSFFRTEEHPGGWYGYHGYCVLCHERRANLGLCPKCEPPERKVYQLVCPCGVSMQSREKSRRCSRCGGEMRPWRLNPDVGWRTLERRWHESGSEADRVAFMRAKVRVGLPIFLHDCEACELLESDPELGYDYYVCDPKGRRTGSFIARHGDKGPEYWSSPLDMLEQICVSAQGTHGVPACKAAHRHGVFTTQLDRRAGERWPWADQPRYVSPLGNYGEVGFSELAMHTRTAGLRVIQFALLSTDEAYPRVTWAMVMTDNGTVTDGLPSEVLPAEIRRELGGFGNERIPE